MAQTRAALAAMTGSDVEIRVATSIASLGLFARLLSPVIAATVLEIEIPRPDLGSTLWQPVVGGPLPLSLTGTPAAADVGRLVDEVLIPLSATVQRSGLSAKIVHGNLASAAFGAITMIGQADPELAGPARTVGLALLEGRLAGAGQVQERFVRSSCCLYYRIRGGGYCGDCVLA